MWREFYNLEWTTRIITTCQTWVARRGNSDGKRVVIITSRGAGWTGLDLGLVWTSRRQAEVDFCEKMHFGCDGFQQKVSSKLVHWSTSVKRILCKLIRLPLVVRSNCCFQIQIVDIHQVNFQAFSMSMSSSMMSSHNFNSTDWLIILIIIIGYTKHTYCKW